ncbi:leucine-rich repeat protein [Skeletonema marinoi]|uniref:Leucine-rich repeat protein n=1 Tax=Skeletonema marinoi TaxID=267567 RepID=A0AAD9D4Y4_9STRA|nr:leucine-rich repeat protein [Skeletonema marinoi]
MEYRDYNYYEANAASIDLGDIMSSVENAKILQQLRDGDDTLRSLSLGGPFGIGNCFYVNEDNDWGWLGYFISRSVCLRNLHIYYLPDGEEGHAFVEGIARSKSIRGICIFNILSNEAFTSIMRALPSVSQLEELTIGEINNVGPDGWSHLLSLLGSGVCKLKMFHLYRNNYMGNEGVDVLSNGLRGIGSSLKELVLEDNSIDSGGLSTLVEALQTCTSLEKLYLSGNDLSSAAAAAGLSSLSDWLQRHEVNLNELDLSSCRINDEGLLAFNEGAANQWWLVFSKALCDTSSVNSTYLSNHTICQFWLFGGDDGVPTILPRDISRYLRLHEEHPQHVARCKILMKHPHLDMTPFFEWKLKFLPMAVAWFERAMPCTALTIHDQHPDLRRRVLDESDESFESRKLTAMYEFVRGMPMEVMESRSGLALAAAYDKKIAMIEEVNKIALEQRDRKNVQFEEEITRLKIENERLSGIKMTGMEAEHNYNSKASYDGGYIQHHDGPMQEEEAMQIDVVAPTPPPMASSLDESTPAAIINDDTPTINEENSNKCNMSPSQHEAALRQLILTITPQEVLDDITSPQAKAFQWLVYDDAIDPPLCPPMLNSDDDDDATSATLLERYIMTAFYHATNGDNWKECSAPINNVDNNKCTRTITAQSSEVLSFVIEQAFSDTQQQHGRKIGTHSWLTSTPTCDWGGLGCSYTSTTTSDSSNSNHHYYSIDQIEFEDNNLSGTLLPELSTLKQLKFLILEKGHLSGSIPPSYGSLSNLRVLDMDYNNLTGAIPNELYDLVELRELDLNDNRLSGTISTRIGRLSELVYLQVDNNEFGGSVPVEVGGLNELAWAVFHGNNFSGEMPLSVCENSDKASPPGKITLLSADCLEDGPVVCSYNAHFSFAGTLLSLRHVYADDDEVLKGHCFRR